MATNTDHQHGIDFRVDIGPRTEASGAGNSTSDLTVADGIFHGKDESNSRVISISGTQASVASFVSETNVKLNQDYEWSDGDTVKKSESEIGVQDTGTFTVDTDTIDVTSKQSGQIQEILPSIRDAEISTDSFYIHDDPALIDLILGILNGADANVTFRNANESGDDRTAAALVSELEIGADYEEAGTVSLTLQVTGGVTQS